VSSISVSTHAMIRALERVRGADLRDLWSMARDADSDDFEAFEAYYVAGSVYRVARHHGEDVLLIMKNGCIVTVRVKPG
jgi:ABC-type arginine/histidine transport system permease subunit